LRALLKAPALHCSGVLRRRGKPLRGSSAFIAGTSSVAALGFRTSDSTISRAFDADVIHSLRPR
jgi:hypothetical protein